MFFVSTPDFWHYTPAGDNLAITAASKLLLNFFCGGRGVDRKWNGDDEIGSDIFVHNLVSFAGFGDLFVAFDLEAHTHVCFCVVRDTKRGRDER